MKLGAEYCQPFASAPECMALPGRGSLQRSLHVPLEGDFFVQSCANEFCVHFRRPLMGRDLASDGKWWVVGWRYG